MQRWKALALAGAMLSGGAAFGQAARCADGSVVGPDGSCAQRGGVVARAKTPDEKVGQLPFYPSLFCKDGTTTTETGAEACSGHGGLGAPDARAPSPANNWTATEPTR